MRLIANKISSDWPLGAVRGIVHSVHDHALNIKIASHGLHSVVDEAKFGEQARVAVRNVRRDGMDSLKKSEKEGSISKDEQHTLGEDIQKLTDEHIALIDEMVAEKEQEILQV